MRLSRAGVGIAALLGVAALPGAAGAYDQAVHAYLSARAYPGPKTVAPSAPPQAATDALRARVWQAGSGASDPKLAARFLARYPNPAAFDVWAFKEFLGLNPERAIAGLDATALPAGSGGAQVYALASRLPDDDFRNRDRFRHDASRKVLRDAYGQPVPDDPATLEMGGLTGLSSQAHAHYQLPRLPFSDDPAVLKRDPRRFAIPPTVHTFGADYAELYTELAVLAAHLPNPDERLVLTLSGAAAHHLEDVANQIHTVQVGIYDFFVDAKIESIKEELRSMGGILRSRPTFVAIGIDIISNHHTLAESLYEKHLLRPGDPVRALTEHQPVDPAFALDLGRVKPGCAPGFARALTYALADRSSYEGPEVYQRIRDVAQRRYSRVGNHFTETEDPDLALRPGAKLDRFYALEALGARRSDQVLAAWWQRFDACRAAGPDVDARFAEALVSDRLDALDAADARARAYLPKAPVKEAIDLWVPAGYLLLLLAAFFLGRRLRRRRRGRA
ncbi:MAG TPA: hypothetical protein VII38_12970 [Polyangia bacterium]